MKEVGFESGALESLYKTCLLFVFAVFFKYRSYLQKACQLWSRQEVITPNLVKSLTTHLDSDHVQV